MLLISPRKVIRVAICTTRAVARLAAESLLGSPSLSLSSVEETEEVLRALSLPSERRGRTLDTGRRARRSRRMRDGARKHRKRGGMAGEEAQGSQDQLWQP